MSVVGSVVPLVPAGPGAVTREELRTVMEVGPR